VDETLGLPYKNGTFITNPSSTGNDPDDALFQAYDEKSGRIVEGVFLTGWARKASEGLVGIAKRDGEWCAEVLMRYLESQGLRDRGQIDDTIRRLGMLLDERKVRAIRAESLRILEASEKEYRDTRDCIGEFKFATNQEMLALIQRTRERSETPAAR
jgi:ferredoxin--NADP+ reductase